VLDVLYDPGNHAEVIVNPSTPDPFVAARQSAGARMASYAPGGFVISPHGGPDAQAPASSSAADQLEKLVGLRERGALTEEELELQKRRILEGM
jgi:hypothetical protein